MAASRRAALFSELRSHLQPTVGDQLDLTFLSVVRTARCGDRP